MHAHRCWVHYNDHIFFQPFPVIRRLEVELFGPILNLSNCWCDPHRCARGYILRLGIPRRFALHLLPFTLFQVAAFAAVSVSISPTTTSLPAAGTQQFTATVLNTSNTAVTWQVNGTTGGTSNNGTISTSGLYAAPAKVSKLRVITVKAISKADTTKSASAKVTLTVSPVSVSISPPTASLAGEDAKIHCHRAEQQQYFGHLASEWHHGREFNGRNHFEYRHL